MKVALTVSELRAKLEELERKGYGGCTVAVDNVEPVEVHGLELVEDEWNLSTTNDVALLKAGWDTY